MSKWFGALSTRSASPFLSDSRKNPRRCGSQVYSSFTPSSRATSWAILFSNPCISRLENGRLSGSAQTRRAARGFALSDADSLSPRCAVASAAAAQGQPCSPGATVAPTSIATSAAPAAQMTLRKTEHIQRPSLGGVLRQVLHRVDEAEGGGAVALVQVTGDDRAGPAADPGQDRHVLLTV